MRKFPLGKIKFLLRQMTVYAVFLAFCSFMVLLPRLSFALPQGYSVQSGSATFDNSNPNALIINASNQAIIDFNSFSIDANESVQFSGTSSVLNRVTGSLASNIYGGLSAPGQFILVNPNGIYFAPSANVQVGSLIASTLDIQNAMYLSNHLAFEKQPGALWGSIVNEANISAHDIVLLADQIQNKGILTANLGTIALATGEQATLSFSDDGLINVVVDKGVGSSLQNQALIDNQGTLQANGGKIILNAKTFSDNMDTLVNNKGLVQADSTVERNGVIEIVSGASMKHSGTLSAKGGTINLAARHDITLEKGSSVESSLTDVILGGSWINEGVNFVGAFPNINFNDAAQVSNVVGDNTFHNLTCLTPGKTIVFEADTLTTVEDTLTIRGGEGGEYPDYPNYITLESSIS
ncbi:MAG: filamentous hemagglutinin N-terminal domain-containing protein, partial [Candidatus Omnitrophica bacterium]|nr:filamentous hemagglutinin N-terminal domain-containing protein [Candidatus Omnitrophota bacterium]